MYEENKSRWQIQRFDNASLNEDDIEMSVEVKNVSVGLERTTLKRRTRHNESKNSQPCRNQMRYKMTRSYICPWLRQREPPQIIDNGALVLD